MSIELLNDVAGSAVKKVLHGVGEALREEMSAVVAVAESGSDAAPQLVEASFVTPDTGGSAYSAAGDSTAPIEACPDVVVVEDSVTIEPGCSGVIEGLREWAENTTAGPDTYPDGSIPDRLIEAKLNGTLTKEATAIAKEQGLFRPGEAKDSFNLWADSQIRMSQDGGLQIVNPNGGVAYTLWDQCDQGAYTGSRMISTGPCGTEPVAESLPPPPSPEVVYEPAPEPEIIAEPVEPEAEPTPEPIPDPAQFTDSRQKLWLAVCPDGGYTCRDALKMNVLRETHILEAAQGVPENTLAERLEETRRVLLNDPTYQTGIANKFFIFVDDDGSLKCVYLRTGEIDTYDPNANARANGVVHKVGPGDGRSYLIGTLETERGGGIRTSESDLYFPGEPLRVTAIDVDGDGDVDRFEPIPRSVEETQVLNRAVVGEDVFGDRGGLDNPANQEKWNWILTQQLPEGFFDASPKEQISMLMKNYGLTRDQANDLVWYLKTVMTGPTVEEVQARLGVDRKFAEVVIHYFFSYNSQGMPSPDADAVYQTFGKYGVTREQAQDIANYMRTEELSPKRSGTREIPFGKLGYTKAFAADGTPKTLGQIFDDAAREAKQRGNIY